MRVDRLLFILGGVEIVFGGAVNAWPDAAPQIIGITVMVLGFATIFYGVFWWERGLPLKWVTSVRFIPQRRRWPFCRLIKLSDAANLAYEKTPNTLAAGMAEHQARRSKDDTDVLSLYVRYLVGDGNGINVWGCPRPRKHLKKIDPNLISSMSVEDGGNRLVQYDDPEIIWEPVWVLVSDLKRRIKEINEESSQHVQG